MSYIEFSLRGKTFIVVNKIIAEKKCRVNIIKHKVPFLHQVLYAVFFCGSIRAQKHIKGYKG